MDPRELRDATDIDREVRDELELHRELLAAELRRGGLSQEEVAAEVARRFGDRERHAEECRRIQRRLLRTDRRRLWFEDLGRDTSLALRELRRSPGYAIAAIVTLGVAVGATSVIFSLLWGVALRPLPIAAPERVYSVTEIDRRDGDLLTVSPANFADWRERGEVFSALAAIDRSRLTLTGDGEPERLIAAEVTEDFFAAVGVVPALGRTFSPDEHAPDGDPVVILGHRLWRNRFGGDADLVGGDLILDGVPARVVGVMPDGFRLPSDALTSTSRCASPSTSQAAAARTTSTWWDGCDPASPSRRRVPPSTCSAGSSRRSTPRTTSTTASRCSRCAAGSRRRCSDLCGCCSAPSRWCWRWR
jgi:hypothetical protein